MDTSSVSRYLTFSPAEAELIAPYIREVSYDAGAKIFPAGAECRDLVLLSSGLVRAFYLHATREVNLRLLCAPAVAVALSSLISGGASSETLEAVSVVSGRRMRIADFERDHPGELAQRMRRVLAEQHYLSMERRLHMLQWKSARERYAYFVEHMEVDIVRNMPGYHVASYLGVAPESLSRVRAARSGAGRVRSSRS